MSIRALASELYRAQQKVHKLQDQLEVAGINKKDQIRRELKQAEVECNQLRRIIEAEKEPSPLRDSFKRHY
ncbi:MAG: hypothetical protein HKP41_22055 [Desulfobacterales bacterium]|nr:hypothetical protein [Desulfobacterales bacterium]